MQTRSYAARSWRLGVAAVGQLNLSDVKELGVVEHFFEILNVILENAAGQMTRSFSEHPASARKF